MSLSNFQNLIFVFAMLLIAMPQQQSAHCLASENQLIGRAGVETLAAEESEDAVKDADEEEGEESASESDESAQGETNGKHKKESDERESESDTSKEEETSKKGKAEEKPKKKKEAAEKKKAEEKPKKKEDPRAKRIAEMEAEMKELRAKAGLLKARQDAELQAMKLEVERLAAQTSLESARRKKATATYGLETDILVAENSLLKQKLAKLASQSAIAKAENAAEVSKTTLDIVLADNREKAKSRVLSEMKYKSSPFQGGELCITDRRIPLNGVITSTTATYIAERIHFFNNLSEDPIFIVIDSSPGGSVMSGYRIMKAMEASDAPVHVVVKSYAASMAAIITTLADDSYAYPNAIMLHHQMSGFIGGNMTEQAEQLEVYKEWARRIMEPLSEKLGTTPEQFVKDMYENSSTGDWEEFADKAHELGWVANIVPRIREESVVKKPTDSRPSSTHIVIGSALAPLSFDGPEETDERGARFKRLPRLQPFDFYFVHNPDDYYRY